MMSKKLTNETHKVKILKKFPLPKPRSSLPHLSKQSKYHDRRNTVYALPNIFPKVRYHSWESKYQQTFTREKTQKAMVKDTYALPISSMVNANETIVTKEEVYPLLISSDTIHIEKPIIHKQTKVSLPRIVRYVRNNDVILSELFIRQTSINNENSSNQVKARNDALFIRKPLRRLMLNTILEEIPECCNSENCSCDIALSNFCSITRLVIS